MAIEFEDIEISETANRKSKDSVFVNLFSKPEYILRLYKELHPEDTNIDVSQIKVQTLTSILVNTQYNDLGFTIGDRLIILVEAQSMWNPNISVRMLMYLAATIKSYLKSTKQNEHSSHKISLPIPELYVVYSGTKKVARVVSLNKDFFCGKGCVDVKVKVLRTLSRETIYGQYIGFCRVYDEQKKLHGDKLECSRETVRISIERGYLAEYLKEHESEVISMLEELFDEEYIRQQYDIAEAKKHFDEGRAEGKAEGKVEGKAEGKLEMIDELLADGVPRDKVLKYAKITDDEYERYLSLRDGRHAGLAT